MVTDPSRMLDISNYLYGFAALLTLIATFGVIYYGRVTAQVKDAQVQQYQKEADERIASANLKAADAFRKGEEAQQGAAGANATAETAKAQAAIAQAESARAGADAAEANAEAKKSEAERAAVELKLQELTAANLQQQAKIETLEAEAKPRTINPSTRTKIIEALTPFKGSPVKVQLYARESEASAFTQQVCEILSAAGLVISLSNMMDQNGTGFGIALHSPDDVPSVAAEIAKAFTTHGVTLLGVAYPDKVEPHDFFVFIGAKPRIIR